MMSWAKCVVNAKNTILEMFAKGSESFCRLCMKNQLAYPTFTDEFTGLLDVVNTKFLKVGELFFRWNLLRIHRAYKWNK